MKSKKQTIQSLLDQLDKNDDHQKFIVRQIETHLDEMYSQAENYELFIQNDFLEFIAGNEIVLSKVLGLPLDIIEDKISTNSFSVIEIRFIFFYLTKWLEGVKEDESKP